MLHDSCSSQNGSTEPAPSVMYSVCSCASVSQHFELAFQLQKDTLCFIVIVSSLRRGGNLTLTKRLFFQFWKGKTSSARGFYFSILVQRIHSAWCRSVFSDRTPFRKVSVPTPSLRVPVLYCLVRHVLLVPVSRVERDGRVASARHPKKNSGTIW